MTGAMWIDQRGSEVLEGNECLRLLAVAAKHRDIGRLGISTSTSPIIVPVNFVYHDAGVLCRIGVGTLADMAPGSLVAFEVDRVDRDAHEAWSVLMRGGARILTDREIQGLSQHQLPEPLVQSPGNLLRRLIRTERQLAALSPR
jgi:nitroimidazol reductase NimA-like FMN-containing flavoprotein (pyridoxamine 5'-phosphate oxidase superfamily)